MKKWGKGSDLGPRVKVVHLFFAGTRFANSVLLVRKGNDFGETNGGDSEYAQKMLRGELPARLRRSEGAIMVAVHRLRHRYRELMRAPIAEMVGEGDVEEELRHLLALLSG
jgi:hypothetical protein